MKNKIGFVVVIILFLLFLNIINFSFASALSLNLFCSKLNLNYTDCAAIETEIKNITSQNMTILLNQTDYLNNLTINLTTRDNQTNYTISLLNQTIGQVNATLFNNLTNMSINASNVYTKPEVDAKVSSFQSACILRSEFNPSSIQNCVTFADLNNSLNLTYARIDNQTANVSSDFSSMWKIAIVIAVILGIAAVGLIIKETL